VCTMALILFFGWIRDREFIYLEAIFCLDNWNAGYDFRNVRYPNGGGCFCVCNIIF